jgi:hypothetical protein
LDRDFKAQKVARMVKDGQACTAAPAEASGLAWGAHAARVLRPAARRTLQRRLARGKGYDFSGLPKPTRRRHVLHLVNAHARVPSPVKKIKFPLAFKQQSLKNQRNPTRRKHLNKTVHELSQQVFTHYLSRANPTGNSIN